MRKIGVVAATEIGNALRSKAFIVGVLLVPIIMLATSAAQPLLENRVDQSPKRFVVLDRTGVLFEGLARAAAERNVEVAGQSGVRGVGGPFAPERLELGTRPLGDALLELSDRARRNEIFAFVDLPPELLDLPGPGDAQGAPPGAGTASAPGPSLIRYYSDHPTYTDLPRWVERTLGAEIRERRYHAAGLDPALVRRLEQPVGSEHLGLLARAPDGTVRPAEAVDELKSFLVPVILMMLLFFPVMVGGPPLLQAVIEEKMSRISEVLLGSVSPFELMMGKLLGGTGVSLLLGALYLGAGLGVLSLFGLGGLVPPIMFGYYLLFLCLAALLFGSIYLAVGSACSEPRDAQSLMMPVLLLNVLPTMTMLSIIRAPSSGFAVGMSLFPPATPFIMLMRLACHPPPPLWQVGLSIVLTVTTVVGCVWAASRIFRVGLLAQGKAPSFAQLLRWIFAK